MLRSQSALSVPNGTARSVTVVHLQPSDDDRTIASRALHTKEMGRITLSVFAGARQCLWQ